MAPNLIVLVETAAGYALLDVVEMDEVASMSPEVQKSLSDFSNFKRVVKLKSFVAFKSAEMALTNINELSEHIIPEKLATLLKKLPKCILGVIDPELGKAIAEFGIKVRSDDVIREISRGARQHLPQLIPELQGTLEQSQLGLGHAYSRAKVKFNPARNDNMIIQCIGLLDTLDKDINTFAMRCREWYSWHFPELRDLVRENYAFARAAQVIGDRSTFLQEPRLEELARAVVPQGSEEDMELAETITSAARMSMGMDCLPGDMANIMHFTSRMISLAKYRFQLAMYLKDKMFAVAPNLATLVGESVGARLISKAGSLTSLAKCPASTIQILGAEKALFRALKKKGNTPKYGLIYHSTFIGRANKKNKGRISRYLANKCAIASRIDAFSDQLTEKYGETLRDQVEERLRFFDTGVTPRKNIDVMAEVAALLKKDTTTTTTTEKKDSSTKKKKRKTPSTDDEKKKKKKKKQDA